MECVNTELNDSNERTLYVDLTNGLWIVIVIQEYTMQFVSLHVCQHSFKHCVSEKEILNQLNTQGVQNFIY